MSGYKSICIDLIHAGWNRDVCAIFASINSDKQQYSSFSACINYHFKFTLNDILFYMPNCKNYLNSSVFYEICLAAPGLAELDYADIALEQYQHNTKSGKKLANLCVATSALVTAKMLNVWAAGMPMAYLIWYIVNNFDTFTDDDDIRSVLLEYLQNNSFIKYQPSLTLCSAEKVRFNDIFSAADGTDFEDIKDDYINHWESAGTFGVIF